MTYNFHEFENLLLSKLKTTSIGLAVITNAGSLIYENLQKLDNKKETLALATETILRITEIVNKLTAKIPELLIYKSTKAFLIIIPSYYQKHFYVFFGANSSSPEITQICLQNTIETFEKRYITS